ncbi:MAG: PTS transporter subunit EIIA [Lachnospiraceae bacterium]|nr:PTS transporter subunit EIIA [Lachnospiraceae bacterium]
MRIADLLDRRSIDLYGKAATKQEILDTMINLMCAAGRISDKKIYKMGVYAREKEGTTGIGDGIAIPHAKSEAVKEPGLAAMVIREGTDFDSLDGEPVYLLFLIAAPNTKENVHLDVLSKLSALLMDSEFTKALREARSIEEFINVIDDAESAQEAEQQKKEREETDNDGGASGSIKILAVTGCPTGIAHTYMAAEALEQAARQAGCRIKVETRGSGGAKNVHTGQEIREADCIIVAADTNIPMERYIGKKVIKCQVSAGISKAGQLIERAISGDVPVYAGESNQISVKKEEKTPAEKTGPEEDDGIGTESFWHVIYKNLMNGVSHMLPFVVGGGILIALAFMIDGFRVDINALTEAERGNFGSITSLARTFKSIGDAAFAFMLPILAGYIAMSIADRPGLAVGIVGGYLAASGKSGFLGALVAGFVAGYLILLLRKIFQVLPESIEGLKPILLYPLFGIFIMGLLMQFAIEPFVGGINTSLNSALNHMGGTSRILLGILVAGMMAVDLGGPINKAAYVFGTLSIAEGNYDIMAAVMIGGMVPPCAIALATLIFRNKFTSEERKSGPVNFIMGLSFITEGAIPFAAADPLRVIPACVIGSGVAGALSMAFKCTLMAPHGGIFVFPVVGNTLLYLLALGAGTAAGALMLGVFKKSRA